MNSFQEQDAQDPVRTFDNFEIPRARKNQSFTTPYQQAVKFNVNTTPTNV